MNAPPTKLTQIDTAMRRCRIDATITIHPRANRVTTECPHTARMLRRAGIPMRCEHPHFPGIGWDAQWWGMDVIIDRPISDDNV